MVITPQVLFDESESTVPMGIISNLGCLTPMVFIRFGMCSRSLENILDPALKDLRDLESENGGGERLPAQGSF